jgi:hypothetical protein
MVCAVYVPRMAAISDGDLGARRPGTIEHPLYFLHLAKTGGSSLTRLLEDAFPAGSRLPVDFADDFLALSAAERRGYPLLCGHLGRCRSTSWPDGRPSSPSSGTLLLGPGRTTARCASLTRRRRRRGRSVA